MKTLWYLVFFAPTVIFFVVAATAVGRLSGMAGAIIGVIGVALLVFLIWYINKRYECWKYAMSDEAFIIERGVFWQRRNIVPYFRIQQIDLNRDPLARILGLSALLVSTASRQADPVVYGLNRSVASQLRASLVNRVGDGRAV